MSKKPIIVFEGIKGTGKSYHIRKISNYLRKENKKFIYPLKLNNIYKIIQKIRSNNFKYSIFLNCLIVKKKNILHFIKN